MARPVILCVDDEKSILLGLKQELEHQLGERFEVEIAENAEEALEVGEQLLAEGIRVPVLLTDQLMPGMKGDELIVRFRQLSPETRSILLTGQAGAEAVGKALNQGHLYRFLSKPWEPTDLRMTVREAAESYLRAMELRQREAELRRLTDNLRALSRLALTHELGQAFLTQLTEDTGADVGVLFQADAFGDLAPSLVLRREGAFLRAHDEAYDYPIDVVNQAWLTGEPAYEPHFELGRSCYASVVAKGGVQYAGIYLEWPEEKALTDGRAQYLRLMVSGTASFFESGRLYQNLEETVTRRTREIEEQNHEIEASIRYAKRIQKAFLPGEDDLSAQFHKSFLYFEPKEHVSGDFFWLHTQGAISYLAVGDATGLGPPAAFLTLQVCSILNLLVGEKEMSDPADILRALHVALQQSLKAPEGEVTEGDDATIDLSAIGTELALCRIDPNRRKLSFAGAQRAILHARGPELKRYNGQKLVLGHQVPATDPAKIKTQTVPIDAGDRIFLYTDGFWNQPRSGEKLGFGEGRFQDLVAELSNQPMSQLKARTQEAFADWLGGAPQADDLLLLGLGF
ncbi:MAG: SpoIIE family protein phosphatase [Bacteroidia bacterium]|nr:SpoIIE family protein phosphatase [Bacteroidia bacterium]